MTSSCGCSPIGSLRRCCTLDWACTTVTGPSTEWPSHLCGMVLYGVATRAPRDSQLDGSKAMQAVEEVMRSWDDGPVSESDRSALDPSSRPN